MNSRTHIEWTSTTDYLAVPPGGLIGAAAAQLAFLHQRRRRLPQVCDTGWAILLETYVAGALDFRLATKALESVAGVPHSTLLRYLAALDQEGLIVRATSPDDRRVTTIRITPRGVDAVAVVFGPRLPEELGLAA